MFQNISLKSTPLRFIVKSWQNSENTHVFFFLKKKIIKIFKDSGMTIFANSDQNLNPNNFF